MVQCWLATDPMPPSRKRPAAAIAAAPLSRKRPAAAIAAAPMAVEQKLELFRAKDDVAEPLHQMTVPE